MGPGSAFACAHLSGTTWVLLALVRDDRLQSALENLVGHALSGLQRPMRRGTEPASHGCFSLMESRSLVVSVCSALALGCGMEISLDMDAAIGRKVRHCEAGIGPDEIRRYPR